MPPCSSNTDYYVYSLCYPDRRLYVGEETEPLPFYIGKGKGERLNQHVVESHRKNQDGSWRYKGRKANTVRKLVREGKRPLVVKLEDNLTEEEAYELECMLVKAFGRRDLGTGILCNHADGGIGPVGVSEETRRRMGDWQVGRTRSETTKRRIRETKAKNPYVFTDEDLQKMAENSRNRVWTDESRKKLSESLKGRTFTEDHRAKISASKKNANYPPETYEKSTATRKAKQRVANDVFKLLYLLEKETKFSRKALSLQELEAWCAQLHQEFESLPEEKRATLQEYWKIRQASPNGGLTVARRRKEELFQEGAPLVWKLQVAAPQKNESLKTWKAFVTEAQKMLSALPKQEQDLLDDAWLQHVEQESHLDSTPHERNRRAQKEQAQTKRILVAKTLDLIVMLQAPLPTLSKKGPLKQWETLHKKYSQQYESLSAVEKHDAEYILEEHKKEVNSHKRGASPARTAGVQNYWDRKKSLMKKAEELSRRHPTVSLPKKRASEKEWRDIIKHLEALGE